MKKILIIGIAIAAVILLAVAIIFYATKNNSSQNMQTENQTPSQISAPVLPGTENAKVDTQNISQSIQENISKAKTSGEETLATKFQDAKGGALTLDQFKSGANITIKPDIYDNLNETNYSIFSCDDQKLDVKGQGLIMRFKSGTTAAYYADLYKKMDENLASWEKTIFSDLAPLLFSGKKISQNPVFKNTKYTTENGAATIDVRYANVKSDDGSNFSIDYAVYAENVFVFNDPQCLRKALDKYEPVLEP